MVKISKKISQKFRNKISQKFRKKFHKNFETKFHINFETKFRKFYKKFSKKFRKKKSKFEFPTYCACLHLLPSGQKPTSQLEHITVRTWRDLQLGPCLQNPLAYQGHSFTFEFGSIWRYWQSRFSHLPYFEKKWHSGIFVISYSCKNSQSSPFLHRPRSQCLQTTLSLP